MNFVKNSFLQKWQGAVTAGGGPISRAGDEACCAEDQARVLLKPPNNCYISTSTSPRLTTPTPVLLTGKYGDDYSEKVFLVISDIFDMPLPSRKILNFKLGTPTDIMLSADELAELTLIRAVKLPCYNEEYIMPLLHDDTVQCFLLNYIFVNNP